MPIDRSVGHGYNGDESHAIRLNHTLKPCMAVLQIPFLTRNTSEDQGRILIVNTEEAFQRLERVLQTHSLIALDTESNNCHSYAPRICLVQFAVSTSLSNGADSTGFVFLLDPRKLDLRRLSPYFADPNKLFLFHSAANDLGQLWQEYRITIANLFDTQVAARLIGMKRTALSTILELEFEIEQSKSAQTSDWGRRPLSDAQIRYASQDVIHLIPLYRSLLTSLREKERLYEGLAVMEEIAHRDYSRFGNSTKTFWDYHATKRVPIHLMNVYQSLWNWREGEAKASDLPRHKIIGDKPLLLLTREQPTNLLRLQKCSGLSSQVTKIYGKKMLAAIEEGKRKGKPKLPENHVVEEQKGSSCEQQRDLFQQLRKWRQEISLNRGVDSDFVLGKHILQVIAEDAPASLDDLASSKLLSDWKFRHYGRDVVQIVRNVVLSKP